MRRFLQLTCLLLSLFFARAAALELVFLDVGQGTSVLILADDGRAVLYDGGPPGTDVAGQLEELGVTDLTLVIASHAHADHIGGLPEAIRRFRPGFFMDNALPHPTLAYERMLLAVQEAGSRLLEPTRRVLSLGEATLTVIPPPGVAAYGQNDNSIGLRVEYGDFVAVLPGDAERAEWDWWLAVHPDLFTDVDVLLASHHGSRNGDTAEGLRHMSPDVVVISLGEDNPYGHPHASAFGLYAGAEVFRTDMHGRVTVAAVQDGSWRATPERAGSTEVRVAGEPALCVDLNVADVTELERIMHIGPARAVAVVEWRPFAEVTDLARVRGIGEARLADIVEQGTACVSPGEEEEEEAGE